MGNEWIFKGKLIAVLALSLLLFLPATTFAAEFSADMHMKSAGGEFVGKVYVKGKMQRQEGKRAGEKFVSIIRLDKNVIWNLMEREKMYMEMGIPNETRNDPDMEQRMKDIADKKDLGVEKVDGYTCQKYQYIFHDKSKGTVTQWFSKKVGYPIKMIHKSGTGTTLVEYKNIKLGKLKASLFEVPKGYRKFQMPGMPGGMKFPR